MVPEEGWVGIADVAAHLSVGKDSIYRWVDLKGLPGAQGGTALTLSAFGGIRVGEGRGWQ